MENHQKSGIGNAKILSYLAEMYLYPNSFETLIYASQLLQAEAIKYGVEHFRRLRGTCMGSIYWQFNNCWTVASWSSVDYYGRCKALHYAAKKFHAPVAMGLFFEKDNVTVNISNETMNSFKGMIKGKICKKDFSVIKEFECDANVDPLTGKDVFSFDCGGVNIYDTYICVELFDKHGNFVMKQTELYTKPKYFEWDDTCVKYETFTDENVTKIHFTADCFAKGVFIEFNNFDVILSDNCFDITDESGYTVTMDGIYSEEDIKENITVKTVYNIGRD